MVRQHISERLKRFIREQIQTVFRLEVLLLLHRCQYRSFTAAEVANELGIENELAQEQLAALGVTGLVVQSNVGKSKYSYHPADDELGTAVDQLAASYSKQPVPILSLILAERSDRPRVFAEYD